ncbi:helix-turn-helix domain-containing protein [Sphaerotilus mobilis]|uniref:GAF domain-containing protein n=1 Tax=Sphaerotilus mobilis TaxID=47994 RepID=A0A4Q7LUB6_9BURK|nr:helix-turn-helix domain-containing protein [Sphaerotilus mobilis]RZS57802.1 GAF domain-containing protein [Sphaerotilus mobilis]
MSPYAASPFFSSRHAVVELARRRWFEEGVPPTGVISEAVFQSWARCQRTHASPSGDVEFQPVTVSRAHLALQRNRALTQAWDAEIAQLQMLLGTTSCAAMLSDASGVIIGATCAGRPHESLMPVATRIGVDLSEEAVGTTAPGVVIRTGRSVNVQGVEHFFEGVRQMHCAAAPIRDVRGRVAGVFDISSESIPFQFDAAAVASHFASAIENRLLVAQSDDHLVIRVQVSPTLLDSVTVGLIGVDRSGRVAWFNDVGARILGLSSGPVPDLVMPLAEHAFALSLDRLASLPSSGAAPLPLPNGLTVWARADMTARDGRRELHAAVPPVVTEEVMPAMQVSAAAVEPVACQEGGALAAPLDLADRSLRDLNDELIQQVLRECGGNLSAAARRLKVSRGWIYRRLKDVAGHGPLGPH